MKTEEEIKTMKGKALDDLATAPIDQVPFLQGLIFGLRFSLGEIKDAFEDKA